MLDIVPAMSCKNGLLVVRARIIVNTRDIFPKSQMEIITIILQENSYHMSSNQVQTWTFIMENLHASSRAD